MFTGSYHELAVWNEASCSFVYVTTRQANLRNRTDKTRTQVELKLRVAAIHCQRHCLSPWALCRRRHEWMIRRNSRRAFSRAAVSAITRRSQHFAGAIVAWHDDSLIAIAPHRSPSIGNGGECSLSAVYLFVYVCRVSLLKQKPLSCWLRTWYDIRP